jgi:hypothetical protein
MLTRNQLATKANLYFTVSDIPTPQNVKIEGSILKWTAPANHLVMVFKVSDSNLNWTPVNGTKYKSTSINNGIGDAVEPPTGVELIGYEIATNGIILPESGIYKIYSENYDYYSASTTIAYFDQSSNLTTHGQVTADKIFLKYQTDGNRWDFIGFPFDVTKVYNSAGTELTRGTNYWIAKHDGDAYASSGAGWDKDYQGDLNAGGYAMWVDGDVVANKTLIFEGSGTIHILPSHQRSITHYDNSGAPVSHTHGFNLLDHPLYAPATAVVGNGQKYYIYNSTSYAYDVEDADIDNVLPFTSYFIKTAAGGSTAIEFNANPISPVSAITTAISEKLTLWLNNNYKTVVRLNESALLDYDDMYDAPYMSPMSQSVPQIYTINNAGKMAINSIPESTNIPLGFRFANAGEYTLTWDNQLVSSNVTLIDNLGGTVDMSLSPSYTFTVDAAGEINNRFSIGIHRVATRLIQTQGDVKVYTENNTIVVSGLNKAIVVRVYDLAGRTIANQTAASSLRIPLQKGVYIVTVGEKRFKLVNQ